MLRWWFPALVALAMVAPDADAARRSKSARAEFVRSVPCPATGITHGACPGWEVDHVVPLCAGGEDRPHNMQWLTAPDHKRKTRGDVRYCRARRNQ